MRRSGDGWRRLYRNFLLFAAAVRSATSGEAISRELDIPVTDTQADALRFLYLHEHVSMGQIALGLGYTLSGATKAMNRLEDKGWVVRHPCLDDQREVDVSLTPPGRTIAGRIMEFTEQRVESMLAGLSEESLERLDTIIEEFLKGVISDARMTQELCVACGFEGGLDCTSSTVDCVVASVHRELISGRENPSS